MFKPVNNDQRGRPYQMIIRKGLPVSCQVTDPYYLQIHTCFCG